MKLTSNVPHQTLFQEILKINIINAVLIQVQKTILPVYHIHWLHSTGCAVQYQGITLINCLTATVPQFLVSLLWRAFSEQKLKLLTMHLLKKKLDIFFWKLFVPSQKAGVLVKGWSSVETGDSHPSPFPNPLTPPPPTPQLRKILIHKMNDKVIFYRQNYCFDLKGF